LLKNCWVKDSCHLIALSDVKKIIQKKDASGLLKKSFYQRPTLDVARDLLGKYILLIAKHGSQKKKVNFTLSRIVETEGYCGTDPASHSSKGLTPRCAPMFGDPGKAYVYLIYGMYKMLNFVTEKKGHPGAVLIRAVEPILGEEAMARRRNGVQKKVNWTSGPGKLTQALGVEMNHNQASLLGPLFYVLDFGDQPKEVYVSPRVGIKEAKSFYWRFFVNNNSFVSRVDENKLAKNL